ncbi:Hydrogenase transcriptional regulatory protein hupR1 [compost metagenome]
MIELRVPPLRERRSDLPQLAASILARLARTHERATPLLAPSALDALAQYHFPGNVRELENILERALALAEADSIGASDLRLPQPGSTRHGSGSAAVQEEAVVDLPAGNGALPSYIEQMERTAIQKALEENRWNKTRTAAQLGITFRALRYKLKKLGMD